MHPDEAKKLNFEILDAGAEPYLLHFGAAGKTPALNQYVAKGDPKTGTPFAERDLVPHRVAFSEQRQSIIDCIPMTWAEHVWSNIDEIRNVLPDSERLASLSICVLVETSDGLFPIALRSQKVTLYPGYWHVGAAGYVDLKRAQESQSLLHSVFSELHEELNALPEDVLFVRQLGLCRHLTPNVSCVEACFYAKLSKTGAEVMSIVDQAKDTYEGKYTLMGLYLLKDKLKNEPFNPAGAAAVALHLGL
jgi:hypothetical protein